MNNRLTKSLFFASMATSLLLTTACSQSEALEIQSEVVSPDKIKQIIANVERLHPDISDELKQQVAEIAVKSIENQIFVEGGSFDMGDFGMPCNSYLDRPVYNPNDICNSTINPYDRPVHKVTLDSFSMSKYETSVYEFEHFKLAHHQPLPEPEFRKEQPHHWWFTPTNPTGTQKWQEAKDYCLWIGQLTEKKFDLPTEAQWEYAARDRGKYIYYATNDGTLKGDINLPKDDLHPIDSFPPSPLGFYHLQSNAVEWVNDWFDPDYYKHSPEHNPQGPAGPVKASIHNDPPQILKVLRGGSTSWDEDVVMRRATQKPIMKHHYVTYGFRCAIQDVKPIN
ncbi:Formylglycine-generating enzyme, required for sulfatase activity, contains SUMF1/FGE domain [Amphritea atlantica]|uniref:Formylglycine-generating enzyme, required for sulfatase activity, contains SUMF1/FGE domain n=1 Tax=Amphritea atlantica TaxID=355243 RepID=A0A1H9MBV4_9GAMM|nr:SUMF1/EgtB/PvdO family nonheme iron enzyme [Amphritea atlantica]SER20915.1 Formylglycine-generating enzyme, required for sulfatase activity, contains SUMF1/FGE domain [Amphritea atlantica]